MKTIIILILILLVLLQFYRVYRTDIKEQFKTVEIKKKIVKIPITTKDITQVKKVAPTFSTVVTQPKKEL